MLVVVVEQVLVMGMMASFVDVWECHVNHPVSPTKFIILFITLYLDYI